jgi:hypothetical protein
MDMFDAHPHKPQVVDLILFSITVISVDGAVFLGIGSLREFCEYHTVLTGIIGKRLEPRRGIGRPAIRVSYAQCWRRSVSMSFRMIRNHNVQTC